MDDDNPEANEMPEKNDHGKHGSAGENNNDSCIIIQNEYYMVATVQCVNKLLEQHSHNLLTNLLQTCYEKYSRQVVGTALSQLVNKLAANLLQTHLFDKLLESIVTTC
jgi:hypothetical protein